MSKKFAYTPPSNEPHAFSSDRRDRRAEGRIHRKPDHAAEMLAVIDARDRLHREYTDPGAGQRRPKVPGVKITDAEYARSHAAGERRRAAASLPPTRTHNGHPFGRARSASARPR